MSDMLQRACDKDVYLQNQVHPLCMLHQLFDVPSADNDMRINPVLTFQDETKVQQSTSPENQSRAAEGVTPPRAQEQYTF